MSRRADPTLIGGFVLGGAALLVLAVLLLANGDLFQKRPGYVLYFEGSTTGLQVGSPVVFRGVKIGNVESIGLSVNEETYEFLVPVRIRTDEYGLQNLDGRQVALQSLDGTSDLVRRGLRARLKTLSFLTGQLYIDLDFYPDKPIVLHGMGKAREIPTLPTEVQELTNKLDKLNLEKLIDDVSVISDSIRKLVSSPAASSALNNLDATLANLARLTDTLNERSNRLASETRAVLQESAETLRTGRTALDEAAITLRSGRETLAHIDEGARNVAQLTRPDGPTLLALTQASQELARTSRALHDSMGEDSATAVQLGETLKQVTATARSLRVLAESIENQPESLLKGRAAKEDTP